MGTKNRKDKEELFTILEEVVIDSIRSSPQIKDGFINRISDPNYKIREWEKRVCKKLFDGTL